VFVADIEVVNKGSGLIPGMTCTAQFFSKPAAGLRIPVAALRFRLKNDSLDSNGLPIGRTVVYVRRGNKAVPVPVKLGAINADFAEVVHGEIGPGDEVAVAYGLK
jgi:multidrug efflux pump subunit AcrA (membrane-fusion protein)